MVSTIKKYTLESFSECTGIGNVVEVGRKSVPGGWATERTKRTHPPTRRATVEFSRGVNWTLRGGFAVTDGHATQSLN